MEYSDHELVRGIKGGDKSALELLVRRWYPRIYGYLFKLTGHEQDAYDLTQDVFYRNDAEHRQLYAVEEI